MSPAHGVGREKIREFIKITRGEVWYHISSSLRAHRWDDSLRGIMFEVRTNPSLLRRSP